jgi:hypothetical protein
MNHTCDSKVAIARLRKLKILPILGQRSQMMRRNSPKTGLKFALEVPRIFYRIFFYGESRTDSGNR